MSRVAAAGVVLVAASCGGPSSGAANGAFTGELLVSAAASLEEAFGEIEVAFESAHQGVEVNLNLGGSSALREQILEGAPVDVFASASASNMDQLVASGDVGGDPARFVTNTLQIAVPAGNPAGVSSLDDFDRAELLLGLCAVAVPCGEFAREALDNAGVTPAIDTEEPDVRALLTKVGAGELDAGITYVTDIVSSGGTVEGVVIPDQHNVVASYWIATLAGSGNPEAAEAFVVFVLSEEGQAILAGYGFGPP